jgi:hypothetical protein
MSISSSAAVLGDAFDFNLHLEDTPTNKYFQMKHLFQVTAVGLAVILIWSLSFSSGLMIWQSPNIIQYNNPKIDDMNASFVSYRLKISDMNSLYSSKINDMNLLYASKIDDMNLLYRSKIEDMNAFFNTRVNSINEAITVLKSEISNSNEEKVKLVDIEPFKMEITVNISALTYQIKEQSDLLSKLNELHLTAEQNLEEMRTKQNKYIEISTTSTETQERIKQFYIRIETIKTQQESMKAYQESFRKQQEVIKIEQSVPSISSNTSIESQRISLLLTRIQILEERMSKALDIANGSIDTSDIVINNQNDIRYYDSLAETIISRIWDENKKIYEIIFLPKERPLQIMNDLNIDQKVTPSTVATVPYSSSTYSTYDDVADFAGKLAGGKIIYKETSATYSYPMDIKNIPNSLSNYFGILFERPLSNYYLGLDTGVGMPEDAISSDMSLGSCWPLQVCT